MFNKNIDINNEILYFIDNTLNGQEIHQINTLKNNNIYDMACPDCNHLKDTCQFYTKKKNKKYPDKLIYYKINNYGYRCDNFNSNDAINNYLFSGCSFTFGTGIPYNGTWAYQLNNYLNGSKFFNLAVSGGSTKTIIYQIYEYINRFGKPKGIFLLFPGIDRYNQFDIDNKNEFNSYISTTLYKGLDKEPNNIMNFYFFLYDFINLIKILETYCKQLNIQLLWSTWHPHLHKSIIKLKSINNYVNILDSEEILYDISKKDFNIPSELNNEYWEDARDQHPSVKIQYFYYQVFKNKIESIKNEK